MDSWHIPKEKWFLYNVLFCFPIYLKGLTSQTNKRVIQSDWTTNTFICEIDNLIYEVPGQRDTILALIITLATDVQARKGSQCSVGKIP